MMKEMRKVVSEYRETVKLHTQRVNRLHTVYEHCGITDMKRCDLKTRTNREKNVVLLPPFFCKFSLNFSSKTPTLILFI